MCLSVDPSKPLPHGSLQITNIVGVEKQKKHPVCVLEIHFTVSSITIFICEQERFYSTTMALVKPQNVCSSLCE